MLPDWPEGTVAVLSTAGPHAIPVSTATRGGDTTVHLALAHRRDSLARLRDEPRCALTILAAGDHAFTAHGHAVAFEETEHVVAVRIAVDAIADHNRPTYEIRDGVQWDWTDESERERDAATRAAMRDLL